MLNTALTLVNVDLTLVFFFPVAYLIKMTFTVSTAYVTEIHLAGLVPLRDVIEVHTLL